MEFLEPLNSLSSIRVELLAVLCDVYERRHVLNTMRHEIAKNIFVKKDN